MTTLRTLDAKQVNQPSLSISFFIALWHPLVLQSRSRTTALLADMFLFATEGHLREAVVFDASLGALLRLRDRQDSLARMLMSHNL